MQWSHGLRLTFCIAGAVMGLSSLEEDSVWYNWDIAATESRASTWGKMLTTVTSLFSIQHMNVHVRKCWVHLSHNPGCLSSSIDWVVIRSTWSVGMLCRIWLRGPNTFFFNTNGPAVGSGKGTTWPPLSLGLAVVENRVVWVILVCVLASHLKLQFHLDPSLLLS